MSFDLSTCMDGIAAYAVSQGVTTRAHGYPVPDPTPPCLIVAYPTRLDFDFTFHASATAGTVQLTFPLWFVCGRAVDKAARDLLSPIISGAAGIKVKLDGAMGGTFLQSARAMDCRIESVTLAGVDYLAAVFDLDVIA